MEPEQESFVRNKFSQLINLVICSTDLIAKLIEDGVLNNEEEQLILAKNTNQSRASELLNVVRTRSGGFHKLIGALESCNQTGAVNLLKQFKSSKFKEISIFRPGLVASWFYCPFIKKLKHLVVYSNDIHLTRKRLLASIPNLKVYEEEKSQNLPFLKNALVTGFHGFYGEQKLLICGMQHADAITHCENWRCVEDTFGWHDLTKEAQRVICNTKVLFQGQSLSTNEVCRIIASATATPESEILKKLPTDLLVNLLNRETIEIVGNSLLPAPEPYIQRGLKQRSRLSRRVLNLTTNMPATDVFVIECVGIRFFQFVSFVAKFGNNQCDLSSNLTPIRSKNFPGKSFLLTQPEHFSKICDWVKEMNKNTSVHLLQAKANQGEIERLEWIRSVGLVDNIQKFVYDTKSQTEIWEEEFFNSITTKTNTAYTLPICISETPGMGKSSLLSHLARKLQPGQQDNKEKKNVTFVQRFVMIDFLKRIDDEYFVNSSESKNEGASFKDDKTPKIPEDSIEDESPKEDDGPEDGDCPKENEYLEQDECTKESIISKEDENPKKGDKSQDDAKLKEKEEHVIVSALCGRCSKKSFLGEKLVDALFSYKQNVDTNPLLDSFDIKLELMFDGIEELDAEQLKVAFCVIYKIQYLIPFKFPVRVWVTTAPHLMLETERRMKVFAHIMCPLDKKSQIDLMTKIWVQNNNCRQTDMEELAKSCLTNFCENLETSPLVGDTNNATGLPLMCRLLAKRTKEKAEQLHRASAKEFPKDSHNLIITTMYKDFVHARVDKQLGESCEREIKLQYMQAGVDILFPLEFRDILSSSDRIVDLLQDGIVEKRCVFSQGGSEQNGTLELRFIHSSFAWYCSALALAEILQTLQENDIDDNINLIASKYTLITKFLAVEEVRITLSTIETTRCVISTFQFSYQILCYFLNTLLPSKMNVTRLIEVWLAKISKDPSNLAFVLFNILMASVVSNYINIAYPRIQALNVIYSQDSNISMTSEMSLNLEFLSAKHASKSLMILVEEFINKHRKPEAVSELDETCKIVESGSMKQTEASPNHEEDCDSSEIQRDVIVIVKQDMIVVMYPQQDILVATLTPIHISIEAGNVDVTLYLISKTRMVDDQYQQKSEYRCLLNACVIGTKNENGLIIKNKKYIMTSLAAQCRSLFIDSNNTKNLELKEMHIDMLIEYLQKKEKLESELSLEFREIPVNKYGENIFHLLARGQYHSNLTSEQYHDSLRKILSIKQFTSARVLRYLFARNAFGWRAIDVACSRLDLLQETLDLFTELQNLAHKAVESSKQLYTLCKQQNTKLIQTELDLYNKLLYGNLENTNRINHQLDCLQTSKSTIQAVTELEWVSKLDFQTQARDRQWDVRNDFRGSNIFYKAAAGRRSGEFLERLFNSNVGALAGNPRKEKLLKETILHVACGYLNIAAVKFIIQKDLVDINSKDRDGNTALHRCFRLEHIQLVEKLYYPEMWDEDSYFGEEIPVTQPSAPVGNRFADGDMDATQNNFELFNTNIANFETTLHFFPRSSEVEPNNQQEIIGFLIKNGAKINIKNKNGITPLHLAMSKLCLLGLKGDEKRELESAGHHLFSLEHKKYYLTLALKGLLLNSKLGIRWHPSLISSFAKAIKELGGDLNVTNINDGASLLHLAARQHSLYAVKYLIEKEDFNAKMPDAFGRSPLGYMNCKRVCDASTNCLELRQYLREKLIDG